MLTHFKQSSLNYETKAFGSSDHVSAAIFTSFVHVPLIAAIRSFLQGSYFGGCKPLICTLTLAVCLYTCICMPWHSSCAHVLWLCTHTKMVAANIMHHSLLHFLNCDKWTVHTAGCYLSTHVLLCFYTSIILCRIEAWNYVTPSWGMIWKGFSLVWVRLTFWWRSVIGRHMLHKSPYCIVVEGGSLWY